MLSNHALVSDIQYGKQLLRLAHISYFFPFLVTWVNPTRIMSATVQNDECTFRSVIQILQHSFDVQTYDEQVLK